MIKKISLVSRTIVVARWGAQGQQQIHNVGVGVLQHQCSPLHSRTHIIYIQEVSFFNIDVVKNNSFYFYFDQGNPLNTDHSKILEVNRQSNLRYIVELAEWFLTPSD